MIGCTDLVAFVDGELADDQAAEFRDHLRTCEACGKALPEAVALSARLSTSQPLPTPPESIIQLFARLYFTSESDQAPADRPEPMRLVSDAVAAEIQKGTDDKADREYRAARSELLHLKTLIKIWVDAVDAWETCTIADPKFGRLSSAKVTADRALRATVAFAARVDAHLSEVDRVTAEHTEPRPGLGSPDAFAEALDAAAAESSHPALATLIAQLPDRPPPEGWQDRVHAELDVAEVLEAMSPEQVAELDAMTRGMSMDGSCELPPTLDGVDQSDPAPQPSEPLVEQQDIHSEPTHVGVVDSRFDDTDGDR